jgi:hypothetical protein
MLLVNNGTLSHLIILRYLQGTKRQGLRGLYPSLSNVALSLYKYPLKAYKPEKASKQYK